MTLTVYCRRWKRTDTYQIERTATGWHIQHIMIGGDCDTTGHPYLFENLDHDSINYPAALGGYVDYLWRQAEANKWRDKHIQPKLNVIGRWISKIELSSPKGVFAGYK